MASGIAGASTARASNSARLPDGCRPVIAMRDGRCPPEYRPDTSCSGSGNAHVTHDGGLNDVVKFAGKLKHCQAAAAHSKPRTWTV